MTNSDAGMLAYTLNETCMFLEVMIILPINEMHLSMIEKPTLLKTMSGNL